MAPSGVTQSWRPPPSDSLVIRSPARAVRTWSSVRAMLVSALLVDARIPTNVPTFWADASGCLWTRADGKGPKILRLSKDFRRFRMFSEEDVVPQEDSNPQTPSLRRPGSEPQPAIFSLMLTYDLLTIGLFAHIRPLCAPRAFIWVCPRCAPARATRREGSWRISISRKRGSQA